MPSAKSQHRVQVVDLASSGWQDYELLDSGGGHKLERYGGRRLVRFEPEAIWKRALPSAEWDTADARFTLGKGENQGAWDKHPQSSDQWAIQLPPLTFNLVIKKSRHIGIFPEQLPNWQWIAQTISDSEKPINVLNLFAYTGASTLFAALAGARVTHVDAVKSAVDLAKKNLANSGLSEHPVRWIVDDAFKFVQREIRRGNRYDAIIMDPPKFGRGPGGEVWKFDDNIGEMINQCASLLSRQPLFVVITAYNVDIRPLELGLSLDQHLNFYQGGTQCGRLIQQERSAGRKINQAIYARWRKN
jgi:23S rRNA (cytosine1962-C5)-methyltransferase